MQGKKILSICSTLLVVAVTTGRSQVLHWIQRQLDSIGVQLFYETTGTLSPNIAPPMEFTAWNTIIAEGDAKEPARDLLVTAHLSVPVDEANVHVPLTIKVTARDGKIIVKRTFRSLFFQGGSTVRAVFVPDATC